ncbi:hypothetical protein [Hyphobacterium marinum]|uniref:DUF4440 domain-containing protein n=1 Tax=Hyphobacterium marinum TaxID=3116574 RepID=A0ABU7LZ89_9PROT|nr:hypothetical protein [Hyphobacterium sp. Y6023]MEE2566869.1 hypothetical protein [Hyphobacterium sp. Y6023]
MSDEDLIRDVLARMYAMISGPAGPRDWSTQQDVFHPEARQIRTTIDENGHPRMTIMSPEEYRDNTRDFFANNDFFEIALGCEIRIFGNIAHAWSAYEARSNRKDTAPERRGINSIQLFRDENGRWRIMAMIWDNEREGLALPAELSEP